MNILTYISVLFIGATMRYILGNPGILGMIAGAIAVTLIFFDINRKKLSQTSDMIE
jgi:hypothetical protein